jgi:hypothetical protein
MTTPYIPHIPGQGISRTLYTSVAQVQRLTATLSAGSGSLTWGDVTDAIDPYAPAPGQLTCRLDLQFIRPGKDQQMPLVAGRAPDRVGVLFFDCAADDSGLPLIKSGDRLVMVSGPIGGTFEIRIVPDVAQDMFGAHHMEVQVIEVSQALKPGSIRPFPGAPA